MWKFAFSTLHTARKKQNKSTTMRLFLFIHLCEVSNQRLPGAPPPQVLVRQHCGVERSDYTQTSGRVAKVMSPDAGEPSFWRCAHTCIWEKLRLFFRVWQTDGNLTLTPVRGAFLLLPSTHPKHIPTPWHHMCARCSVITASPNARSDHVLTRRGSA